MIIAHGIELVNIAQTARLILKSAQAHAILCLTPPN